MSENNLLIDKLGHYLGLPLTFEENKPCLLMFDEKLMVAINHKEEQWQFHCMLAELTVDTPIEFYQFYLAMNIELSHKQLGSICYDADSRALVYIASLSMPASFDSLVTFLEEVVDQYEQLHEQVNNQSLHNDMKQNSVQFKLA
ncbi:chaperone SicP [uncultured Shewanella sp.]|uniref:chaperone SicP n=1 Tax=uncultured Shewanella sp. TaxID=173975 RepID=UPI00262B0F8B|nr:chaperone SicP [uncultured Shewanella sp.]